MYNRLDSIPACDRRTERQTSDILPRRGKNDVRPIARFMSEKMQDSAIVTMECE